MAGFAALCLFYGVAQQSGALFRDPKPKTNEFQVLRNNDGVRPIGKKDVAWFLGGKTLANLTEKRMDVIAGGSPFQIVTSLDATLQKHILASMEPKHARYIGIVAMEPCTGRILAMAGHNAAAPETNPCVDGFPAASIFKIVTASAVIEERGFGSKSQMRFYGGRHTLYKNQLKKRTKRKTVAISLEESFAHSVNPVFGKMGMHLLGRATLESYAESFGFNRNIDFEIPLHPSDVSISDEPYNWAEIASGFNRETTLSPVHGALLVSAVLNSGMLVEPGIVDRIVDETGYPVYENRPFVMNRAIGPETSKIIRKLMMSTVSFGTSRKMFRKCGGDPVLSQLHIGGKTGSINDNRNFDLRYDWFVGFAEEKGGPKKIAVSVLVVHDKFIGKRAGQYAKLAMKKYFSDYFDNKIHAAKTRQ